MPVVRIVKRRIFVWSSLLVAIVLLWGGRRAFLASRNLVTLNVRDADVRAVVRKCEWQTWETIVVNKDVKGKVTLNVRKRPLEEVLGIIGEQTSSRATAIYPIFSKGKSIVNLRKLARGDLDRESAGWTNFVMRGEFGRRGGGPGGPGFGGRGGGGFGGPGGPGGFDDGPRSPSAPVTLNVDAKDLGFVATALSRASQSQIVPEDGAEALITLHLSQVPVEEVVSEVAERAKRKWEVFYSLQAQPDLFADRGEDEGRGRRGDGEGRGRFRGEGETNRFAEMRDLRALERERMEEIRLATMTAEEQAKAKEQQQQFEQMRDATPEQRQQMFEQMRNNPQNAQAAQRFEARANNSFKYARPEQRVERARRTAERKARQQQQQQGR